MGQTNQNLAFCFGQRESLAQNLIVWAKVSWEIAIMIWFCFAFQVLDIFPKHFVSFLKKVPKAYFVVPEVVFIVTVDFYKMFFI